LKIRYWAAGILLYGIFLVATAPASLLPWIVNRYAPVELSATHTSGTLWHGTAHQLGIRQAEQAGSTLGDLNWELDFSHLLSGQQGMILKLRGSNASGQAKVWISPSSIQLHDLQLSIPAETLAAVPRIAAWKPEGRLTLNSTSLDLSRETLQGQAEIRWEQASLGISPVRPLGAWEANLNAEGKITQIRLDTLNGPLALKGQGDWSRKGLRFNGTASATDKQDELKTLLALIGRPIPGQMATVEIGIK
jgi:general secretion pathway protein N